MALSPYARRIRMFAGMLTAEAQRIVFRYTDRADFAAAVKAAARELNVRGLAPKDWRKVIEDVTEREWERVPGYRSGKA